MTYKFGVGDVVTVVGYFDELKVVSRESGNCYNWYTLSDGVPYREEQLIIVARASTTIETIYRVDGLEFETLEEAVRHKQKVQLFNILSVGLSDEDTDGLLFLLDTILDNANKLKEILK